jgi:hypothetical protein
MDRGRRDLEVRCHHAAMGAQTDAIIHDGRRDALVRTVFVLAPLALLSLPPPSSCCNHKGENFDMLEHQVKHLKNACLKNACLKKPYVNEVAGEALSNSIISKISCICNLNVQRYRECVPTGSSPT